MGPGTLVRSNGKNGPWWSVTKTRVKARVRPGRQRAAEEVAAFGSLGFGAPSTSAETIRLCFRLIKSWGPESSSLDQ